MVIYRGRGLFPNDISSIKTATTIVDNISFTITSEMLTITYIFVLWMIIIIKFPIKKVKYIYRFATKISILILSIISLCLFTFSTLLFKLGFKQIHWYGHLTNGVAINFIIEGNLDRIAKPDNYSKNTLKDLQKKITKTNSTSNKNSTNKPKVKPNIIAIMDESFADLHCIGNFNTNKPVTEFLDSLSENTISGYALSSVYGGGTATSEFEFLTGASTAFLPSSAIAYQSYINTKTDSLVSLLKKQGYSTIALHPYQGSNYNRINAYKNLGFDKYYYAENLYITPDNDIRTLASDYYDFNKIIDIYNEKADGEKLFLFNVTIQNHGGYDDESDNFDEQIKIDGFNKNKYPAANQYLSLMYETDKAFENLINYFSTVDEPTIILMFGDHQGIVEDDFIKYLYGKDKNELSLEENQKLYKVPFYIWANYDIQEQFIDCTSINYLSTYLLDATGLKKSDYLNYLTYVRDKIPAINNFCYVDSSGTYHSIKGNSISENENKLLHQYQILQYNYLFDKKHKLKNFYSITK
ncbi:LTA synthase family protein [Clostridium sp. MSJ-8]|uniref:LTA synthase family protein n=1 Tax=Clostridium sp. MSJ-8 TaxID=2841510 RepID=UPI001C0F1447|nr:LTA synthase family protein [Clostridium sp. MSJ-8]MBU5488232.1 LTA synthase family protein [Clostridium sp. MSJ-8]